MRRSPEANRRCSGRTSRSRVVGVRSVSSTHEGATMNSSHPHSYPKLHNAMWPGLVGKGSPGAEPTIDLDTMLDLTAAAEVDGIKFDGVDIFLYEPHIPIDTGDDDLQAIATRIAKQGVMAGSFVAQS